jgi:Tfp pilus assembly protein FimT
MDTKHDTHRRRRRRTGLSLIEATVLVAGTPAIATAAVPSLVAFIDGRRLDAAATALAADIQFMRTEAVADGAGSGAIDANIEHPLDYVDVAGSLLAQNFLVVRGDQACPAASEAALLCAGVGTLPQQP